MQLHGIIGEEGSHCSILSALGRGQPHIQNQKTHPDYPAVHHSSPIPLSILQTHCAEIPKPAKEPGFTVRNSCTVAACSMMAPVRLLGAGRDSGGWVVKWQHLSCQALSASPFKWAAYREGVSGKTVECLGAGQESWDREEASLMSCPAVPRKRLVVPNYFLRVFMSTSHMPFCFRSTKQIEMGSQTWWF